MNFMTKIRASLHDFFVFDYPNELIQLFVDASARSSFANFATMLVLLVAAWNEIPLIYLLSWGLFHTAFLFIRLAHKNVLGRFLKEDDAQKIRTCLYKNVYTVAIGGMSWGVITILVNIYGGTLTQFLLLVLLVGLTAGALATLSPVYHAYIYFLIPTLGTHAVVSLFTSNEFHYLFTAIIVVYSMVVISAGNSVYSHIHSAIIYKNQLEELNASLEDRVAIEREKNLEKTRLMFQQSRHAQMGEMISMIAHQWRQPLTTLSANISNLEVDFLFGKNDTDTTLDELKKMSLITDHLSSTVDDFSGFFKEDKQYESVNLEHLVDSSYKMVASGLKAQNIDLVLDFQPTSTVYVLANELRQVILNLIKNAEDVLVHNKIKKPCICIRTYMVEDKVAMCVEDNGGGVVPQVMDKIFDAYFTTKEALNGTGLGLYMSKTIIQEHLNGELSVYNTQKGACFVVTLPQNKGNDAV